MTKKYKITLSRYIIEYENIKNIIFYQNFIYNIIKSNIYKRRRKIIYRMFINFSKL